MKKTAHNIALAFTLALSFCPRAQSIEESYSPYADQTYPTNIYWGYVVLVGMASAALSYLLLLTAEHLVLAYTAALIFTFAFSLMPAPMMSALNDLMLPRGRATISALYLMLSTLTAAALSPYIIGLISDVISAKDVNSGEALRQSMLWVLLAPAVGVVLIAKAISHVEGDEVSLIERAKGLGEIIES